MCIAPLHAVGYVQSCGKYNGEGLLRLDVVHRVLTVKQRIRRKISYAYSLRINI